MISALSQATAHAGQRAKQAAPAQPQPAQQPLPPDDPNGTLPPAPDGSSNNQTQTTTNNQQPPATPPVIVKQKSLLEKALPWVAAGLVSLGGAVVGSYYLGKNFHEGKVSLHGKKLAENKDYTSKFLNPLFDIAKALDEHEKANVDDKATVATLRTKLGISQDKEGKPIVWSAHKIPFEGNKGDGVAFSSVEHDEVQALAVKLPQNIQDLVGTFRSNLESIEVQSNSTTTDEVPSLNVALGFKRNENGSIVPIYYDSKFSNISTGWQVATAKAKDWANKLIKRGEQEEVTKNNKPADTTTEYTGKPRNIEITE
jgi:hypothetical protein